VVTGDILHDPPEWRFFIFSFAAILDVEKIEKSLSILYKKKEKLSLIANNKILQILVNVPPLENCLLPTSRPASW
jgi:hypothetical protein